MKRIVIALTGLLLCLLLKAQERRVLRTGDKIPEIKIKLLTDKGVEVIPISKLYSQKALILDFWATWCGACIKAIKAGDSVVKPFANQVMLLPVSYEDRKTVSAFIKKNKVLGGMMVRYAVEDSVLMGNRIEVKVLPHEVWIDRNGIIKAITYAEDVTTENVALLARNELKWLPVKKDNTTFDPLKPLEAEPTEIIARSLLTRHKEGVSTMSGAIAPALKPDVLLDRYFAINTYLIGLYYSVFSKNSGMLQRDRVELLIKDSIAVDPSLKYVRSDLRKRETWKYSYCYELITPVKKSKKDFYTYLLEELNRILPYTACIEQSERKCYVIVRSDKDKQPVNIIAKDSIYWDKGIAKGFYHQTMETITDYLNWNMDKPVIDESNFKGFANMELNIVPEKMDEKNVFNTDMIRQSLRKYGFDLIEAERMTGILVIRDK